MVASAALMNPLMTGYAERHQVALIVRAAVGERSDMMHKCCEDVSAPLLAGLTKRIPRQVTVTDFLPRIPVTLVLIVPARKILVVSLHNFLVRLAVAALSVCKIRTSCHAAGTFRLSRHRAPPSKKPSRRIASPRRLIPYPILAEYIISLSR